MTTDLAPLLAHDSALGQSTEPSEINAALKALWKENETATRASLMNLAIYSEEADALQANTQLVYSLTLEHACRVLLIEAQFDSSDKHTESWVTAHCSLGPDGRKAVCCEQLAFRMHGFSPARLSNLLFANLDSDLPLVLWWQAPLSGSFDQGLYSRIDRLIIDSQNWRNARADFERLLEIRNDPTQRFVVHDLNWTRTFHLRLAIAAGFEDPQALRNLESLSKIAVTHAHGHETTAQLLGAWLLERLHPVEPEISFQASQNNQPISQVLFHHAGEPMRFEFTAPFYSWTPCSESAPRLFPADSNDLSSLLIDQLGRGGNNAAYCRHIRRLLSLSTWP
jgi:glucose-6-phosphate dehydrogenase assembly protein OpcA